jgi:DNA polymerase-3 subunit alpha
VAVRCGARKEGTGDPCQTPRRGTVESVDPSTVDPSAATGASVGESSFCHLHVHSDFSALDGACKIDDLVRRAAEAGMPAVAVTDHGVLSGAVQLYLKAKGAGVKPIVGLEAYVVEDRFRKEAGHQEERWHLTLLARDEVGYRNLLGLSSKSFIEGYYVKPRADYELLREHAEGIICLSGCPTGRLSRSLEHGRMKEAEEEVQRLVDIFGRENVYIEIQMTGIDELAHVPPRLAELAGRMGLPLVATNDVHYLEARDAQPHDALLCVQTGARLEEEKRMRFSSQEFYFKTEAEMLEAFRDYPEAVSNTKVVADRCDLSLEFDRILLPHYDVPEGFESEAAYLRHLCEEGLERRYGGEPSAEVRERLEMELQVIETMRFPPYFLIVWDFVAYAKGSGIPVGPGRGSAAGSLVSYLLGITDLDPLEYDLLFERFLNPARISMPDIDIDFSVEGRERVIEYVAQKYGRDRVAQIATFGTIKARQAIRDAARVMDVPYNVADRIAKLIPEGPKATLDDCMRDKQDLRVEYDKDETVKKVVDMARPLEGLIRQDSIHAAGVVISDRPLTDYLPLMQKGDAEIVTQVPMGDVEKLGLLKMDFLGLRNLDVLAGAQAIIRESGHADFDLEAIPLDDARTYRMLAAGDSEGVFQFESSGMREALRDVCPTRFEDLIALVALYRPGPMEYIPQYARNKRNPDGITFPDPRLEPILRPTYGVAIYQEQLMEIAKRIGGFSPAEADDLRKGIGKKIHAILDRLEPKFRRGAVENGTETRVVDHLWSLMEKAGDYSFNKSHAACYALIAYRTAYLKANFPVEYMAALISSVMNTKDKVPFYVGVADDMGIEVLPPDVNESSMDFRVVEGRIRFGLNAVKNVGEGAIRLIIAARENSGPFRDIFDFCERVDPGVLNKRALESLIKAGALDSTGSSRKGMLHVLGQAMANGQKKMADEAAGQGSIFDLMGTAGTAAETAAAAENGSAGQPVPIPADDFSKEELLRLEKETLGIFLTSHPLRDLRRQIRDEAEHLISELGGLNDGQVTTIIGMVSRVKKLTTKSGDQMAFVVVQGIEDSIEMTVFPKLFSDTRELLSEDRLVKIRGRVERREDIETKFVPFAIEPFVPKTGEEPVCIKLDAEGVPSDILEDLKSILTNFPGRCPVELHLDTEQGCVRMLCGKDYRVDPQTSLFAELRVLVGETGVFQYDPALSA